MFYKDLEGYARHQRPKRRVLYRLGNLISLFSFCVYYILTNNFLSYIGSINVYKDSEVYARHRCPKRAQTARLAPFGQLASYFIFLSCLLHTN